MNLRFRLLLPLLATAAVAMTHSVAAQAPNPAAMRMRVGGNVQAALLVEQAPPVYPPVALQARIQGTVMLQAIIGKDGTVMQLEVLSGHPLLQQSALRAASQWKYKPTLLNGEAVEVVTTIEVLFSLPSETGGEGAARPATLPPGGTAQSQGGGGPSAGLAGPPQITAGMGPVPMAPLAELRKAAEETPGDPEVRFRLAQGLRMNRELDAAIAEFRAALALNQDYGDARRLLATVLIREKYDVKAGLEEYRELARRNPEVTRARRELAQALEFGYDLDAAITEYRTLVERAPEDMFAATRLGMVLHSRHEPGAAFAQFSVAVGSQPNAAALHAALARDLKNGRMIAAAVLHLREAARLDPTPDRQKALDDARDAEKEAEWQVSFLQTWLRDKSGDTQARRMLTMLLNTKADLEGVRAQCLELIHAAPGNPQAYTVLARAVAQRQGLERAVEEMKSLARSYGAFAPVHVALGDLYLKSGEVEKALGELREAVRLDPNLEDAHRLLATALAASGQAEQARTESEAARTLMQQRMRQQPAEPVSDALRQLREREQQRTGRSGATDANEASAIGSLRTLNVACVMYFTTYQQSFPRALANLGPAQKPTEQAADLIDSVLVSGAKSGYLFIYTAGPGDAQGRVTTFTLHADPIAPGATGTRWFFTDQSGVIRFSTAGRASAASQPIS